MPEWNKIAKKLEGMKLTGLSSRFLHISDKLKSIIDKINKGDMTTLESALSKSDSSLKSLEKGLAETASTLVSLQNGSKNLAKLFDNFANSEILSDVNHLMTNDAAVIAENLATPIKMKTEKIFPVNHFGGVMAPFYNVIAQWVGALFAAVMLRVQKGNPFAQRMSDPSDVML